MNHPTVRRSFLLAIVLAAASVGAFAEVTVVEGEIGPGALYGFYVPDGWNGDVVFIAHGYVARGDPLQLPGLIYPVYRDGLLEMGYAVALSSFSENGFAIKEGTRQTHQLRGLFVSQFGKPRRSYLMGVSMGGQIAMELAEKHPGQYDGAYVLSANAGGTHHQVNHFFAVRALFDYFYPGVLPGDALSIPEGTNILNEIYIPAFLAMSANPGPGFDLASVEQAELQITNLTELLNALPLNLVLHAFFQYDFALRFHDHGYFDNLNTWYSGSSDDDALNAGVDRFGPVSPSALNYMDHHYLPTGALQIPMVTLHNPRDPLIPISHEELYAAAVSSAGASDMLVQQTVDRFGHNTFTPAEVFAGFFGLVNWVENGVVPPSGDVTIGP